MNRKFVAVLAASLVGAGPAYAGVSGTTWTGFSDDDWNTTSWSSGPPPTAGAVSVINNGNNGNSAQTLFYTGTPATDLDLLVVDGSGTGAMHLVVTGLLSVTAGSPPMGGITTVGNTGIATLTLGSGGGLNTGKLVLGAQEGSFGTVNVGPGAGINVGAPETLIVGDAGFGLFNQSGGTTNDNNLIVGNQSTGNGIVNVTGGTMNISWDGSLGGTGNAIIGNSGTGFFHQTNGDSTTEVNIGVGAPAFDPNNPGNSYGGYLLIGNKDGSHGTYQMTDTGTVIGATLTLNVGNEIQIGGSNIPGAFSCGVGESCIGSFSQGGGTVNAGGVTIGIGSGLGTYSISSGALNVGTATTGSLIVGDSGTGAFNMAGGTLNILNQDFTVGTFILGKEAGATGTFTQTGGVVNGGNSLTIGVNGTGIYNLNTGGNPTLTTGIIALGNISGVGIFNQQADTTNTTSQLYIGPQGTYNLEGGTLSVTSNLVFNSTIVGTYGQGAQFNQSGGTFNTGHLLVGGHLDGSAVYTLTGGQLNVDGQMVVGLGGDSFTPAGQLNGLFVQSGGSVVANEIIVGGYFDSSDPNNPAAYLGTGRYEISGGTVTSNHTVVGNLSQGRVLQTGGMFNAGNLELGSAGLFAISDGMGGFNFYSSGTYDLQGGILNTNVTTVSGFGQGTFNQSGASEHHVADNLYVGSQPALVEPTSGVARQGIYNLTGGLLDVGNDAIIGAGNSGFTGEPGALGTFTQSGGTFTVARDFIIGQAGSIGGGTGIYSISGDGSLHVMGSMVVAQLGATGTVNQSGPGSQVVLDGFFTIGEDTGAIGTYNLNGGSLKAGNTLLGFGSTGNPGSGGAGFFNQSGGSFETAFLNIGGGGFTAKGTGTYTLTDGSLKVGDSLNIGNSFGGSGSFVQSGGDVQVNGTFIDLTPGGNISGLYVNTGSYAISAGSLTVANSVFVGGTTGGGPGTFTQTGGSVVVGTDTLASGGPMSQVLFVGALAGANGTYTMSDGTLAVYGNASFGNSALTVGAAGTGHFIQTGGDITTLGANGLAIGDCCGGSGVYDMSGGTLTLMQNPNWGAGSGNAFVGAHTLGTMNQSGGAVSIAGGLFVGFETGGVGGGGNYNQSGGSVAVGEFLSMATNVGSTGAYDLSGTGTLHVAGNAYVGELGVATFTQGAGTSATIVQDLTIGRYNTVTGSSYTQNGGALTTGRTIVGERGIGTFTQNGGTHDITTSGFGDLFVGFLAGSNGTYNLNSGTLSVANTTYVGDAGTGTFTQNGGEHTTGLLVLGGFSTGVGTYNLNAGVLNDTAIVGDAGKGTIKNSGGTQNVSGDLVLGNQSTGKGTYILSGAGALNVNDVDARIIVGAAGQGRVTQTGGTATAYGLSVGNNTGGTGNYVLSGGALNVTGLAGNGRSVVGAAGTGVFTQTGGTHTTTELAIGNNPGGSGTYNLSGGALIAGNANVASAGATGALNYSGGSLTLGGGTGTLTNNAGGEVNFSGGGTRVVAGNLTNSGVVNLQGSTNAQVNVLAQTGGTLNLGANSVTVMKDYTNSNAGSGNSFNPHADVTGTGQIIGNNASQTITGNVASAGADTWTLNLGNVRGGGGPVTLNYQIGNNGTGADIRGAIQTAGLGNITDGRLSGAGVTAGNFGPIGAGGNSGNLEVTFSGASGAALSGQKVAVLSNFDNVTTQVINITGGAVSTLAVGNATPNSPPDVNLGKFRVGGTQPTQNFDVQNTAAGTTATTERLGIGTATTTGNFSATNNLGAALVNPGNTSIGAVSAAVSGGAAGVNAGSVKIQYTTNGVLIDPSFTTINANLQTINVTATGYTMATGNATPSPTITLGAFHVGQGSGVAPQSQAVAITNQAPATQFSEQLGVTSANVSGAFTLTNNIGSALINGGDTLANALNVARNGGAAGNNTGTLAIQYRSDGTNTSGFAATDTNLQNITVQAAGYNLAAAAVTPSPVTVANQRTLGTNTTALTVANTAPVSGFTETLSASFGANTGNATNNGGTVSGIAGGASNNTQLAVGVNTSAAGLRTGTVTVNLASNEVNGSGLGTTALTPQTINVSGNVYQAAQGLLNSPTSLNFGTVQVGQNVQQALSISNAATGPLGFVEDLSAAFGATSGLGASKISGAGSIGTLLAGGTNNSSMVVHVDTSAAASINGSIAVNYFTNGAVNGVSNGLGIAGVGSDAFGVVGTISGQVIDQANPVINNPVISLGNVRQNAASPTGFVSVTNQATGNPQAALNASISASPPITASGSFNLLLPGGTDSTSLQVGMSTASAGHVSGTATVALVSDASNVGGCSPNCQMPLPSQTVQVSGDVYRLANPTLNTTALTLAGRVGGVGDTTHLTGAISITNTSPDIYTESLKVTRGADVAGFTGSGGPITLAAQASSSAIQVSLNTGAAGHVAGNQTYDFVSTGAETGATPVGVSPAGASTTALSGNVYTPAVAQVTSTTPVDFGIRHVGDSVSTHVGVKNDGALSALNDTLLMNFASADPHFTGSGNLGPNGLGAQQTDTTSLSVGMDTSAAGIYSGSATFHAASHDSELLDYGLPDVTIALSGQVNNYALAALRENSGPGSFTGGGTSYTLDFGQLIQGSGNIAANLGVFNNVLGPADFLGGSFLFLDPTDFGETGFDPFSGLAAGQGYDGLNLLFSTAALGNFEDQIRVTWRGSNPSGYVDPNDQFILLTLRANVIQQGAIPEPGTLWLMTLCLAVLAGGAYRRRALTHR